MEVVGQCEGNSREDEVGVLCEGEVSGGSSNVRNMTRARDDECFGDNAHKEQRNGSLSHAREKIARVNVCEVRCTVHTPRDLQGISWKQETPCKKNEINGSPPTLRRSTGIAIHVHAVDEEAGEFDHTFLKWPLSSLAARQDRRIAWLFSLLSQVLAFTASK